MFAEWLNAKPVTGPSAREEREREIERVKGERERRERQRERDRERECITGLLGLIVVSAKGERERGRMSHVMTSRRHVMTSYARRDVMK